MIYTLEFGDEMSDWSEAIPKFWCRQGYCDASNLRYALARVSWIAIKSNGQSKGILI